MPNVLENSGEIYIRKWVKINENWKEKYNLMRFLRILRLNFLQEIKVINKSPGTSVESWKSEIIDLKEISLQGRRMWENIQRLLVSQETHDLPRCQVQGLQD